MKKIAFILSTIAMFVVSNLAIAQEQDSKVNDVLFKISKVCLPDSVLFSVTEGQEFSGGISVFLVSGDKSFKGTTSANGVFNLKSVNGRTEYSYTNKTNFITEKFNAPDGFKAEKIKFVTDEIILYYDIEKSIWETSDGTDNQPADQNDIALESKSLSNGIFEMLAIYTPDFVAFKQVADKEIKEVSISLISGATSIKPLLARMLYLGGKGWDTVSIAGSEFRFSNFEKLENQSFKAQKIKVIADGVEMYYDIDKSMWEE